MTGFERAPLLIAAIAVIALSVAVFADGLPLAVRAVVLVIAVGLTLFNVNANRGGFR